MTILKNGEIIAHDNGKAIEFKAHFTQYGLEGILAMLQINEPDLKLEDLEVVSTTQSSIDGVEKMQRLGIYDDETKRKEYLSLVELGQEIESSMHNFLVANKIYKTYKGQISDVVSGCGFYVSNPEYPNLEKIPTKVRKAMGL